MGVMEMILLAMVVIPGLVIVMDDGKWDRAA